MQLRPNLHLAYCTNIHKGEDWPQTLASLETHTLAVKAQVCPDRPYAIGLRLSDLASRQLIEPSTLAHFQQWLEQHNCYIFTINGFPFGQFHGTRVKEQVYRPDWTQPERLNYTKRLFDILAKLLPPGVEGSVSTLLGSFKEFITFEDQKAVITDQLWECIDYIEKVSEQAGRVLHLGVEPEPLCLWETSGEVIELFRAMEARRPGEHRLRKYLGVNYDTCHLALEYEEPGDVIDRFQREGIRISKIHLSSALQLVPDENARKWLANFADDTYLHQVIARKGDGTLYRYKDLDVALNRTSAEDGEWRVHFHVPLHASNLAHGRTTQDHLLGVLDALSRHPGLCSHLEMETYTWDVLPTELREDSVVDQLVREYRWCMSELSKRGLF